MYITMLGTGSAFAKRYNNNNALIESGNYRLLVDCGITLPKALHDHGVTFAEIDAVLISHIHADHVGGLEELAFQMMFKYGRKPRLFIEESLAQPLWEHTLRGGLVQGELNALDHFFEVRPLTHGQTYELAPGLHVKLIKTEHIPGKDSYSFLFNETFFYTADMVFNGELLTNLVQAGVTTVYHDCQLESPGVVHACLDELLTLPREIQDHIYLMHYGDALEDYRGKTGAMRIVEQGEKHKL
ncbi:MBL fold metallo-hydrolase [Paenibacillus agaridevorans]|uniref:MBL fold metallo-hydrolase n=1 Tax=Paenibacillus agaridevorans TaxID=171404 RepID=A0A2R5ER17_9BACL|nr:MBL fold metallo-hydrolase [Paenibacillus agaridevorans]GBG06213.1 MBL fold metallo-hydrolase [Paenibacillus agaridevorans]